MFAVAVDRADTLVRSATCNTRPLSSGLAVQSARWPARLLSHQSCLEIQVSVLKLFSNASLTLAAITVAITAFADAVPPGTDDEIRSRLAPFGNLCRAGDDCGTTTQVLASGPQSGEEVYNQFCFACHATGASDAPLFADSDAWAPRIAKGLDTLMASTVNGLGMMPARGTCMNCSDEELQAAVDYMLEQVQ